jgi:hypothetical protein
MLKSRVLPCIVVMASASEPPDIMTLSIPELLACASTHKLKLGELPLGLLQPAGITSVLQFQTLVTSDNTISIRTVAPQSVLMLMAQLKAGNTGQSNFFVRVKYVQVTEEVHGFVKSTYGADYGRSEGNTKNGTKKYLVSIYDVFDGNHRITAYLRLIRDGHPTLKLTTLVSAQIYKETLPVVACSRIADIANEMQVTPT